ncbi:MAG: hypothetical protein WDZ72_11845 [Cyclobacteriaceae bacterium]
MKLIRKILPVAAHGLLCLMCLMLVNSMIFYHEHRLSSGEVIRHAHPFLSEEEEQKRNHSEKEILLLDIVSHAQYFLPAAVGFVSMVADRKVFQPVSSLFEDPDVAFLLVLTLRGPPSLFFSFQSTRSK